MINWKTDIKKQETNWEHYFLLFDINAAFVVFQFSVNTDHDFYNISTYTYS